MSRARNLPARLLRRDHSEWHELRTGAEPFHLHHDRWPCTDPKYLLVGSESSGTTAIADLLFQDVRGVRFLVEGGRQAWVWEVYKRVHLGEATIRDFPRLQLFDAIKVPGFAMVIGPFRQEFPATSVVYVVRDPRDFVASALRTWRTRGISDMSKIPWVAEDWLGIRSTDPLERLCLRWKAYLSAGTEAEDVIFIRYEDFYADKASTIRDLAGRLRLPYNERRVDARKDMQISRVRKYAPRGPGSWKAELPVEQVRTVERLCAQEMSSWGYASSVD